MPSGTQTNCNFDNPVAKVITEKTGVYLEFEIEVGDPMGKYALMASSGTYPDLIKMSDPRAMEMMIQAGALVKLDKYIDEYGSDIKKFYGNLFSRLRYSKEDPSIYTFGSGGIYKNPTPATYWDNGFHLQHGALKALNYPQVKSLEDFENAIKEYLKMSPKTPEGQKRIGLTLITADGWRHFISLTNPANYANGRPDNGEWVVDGKDLSVKIHYKTEGTKEYFRWLNKLYNDGILDTESFTQNYDTYKSKIASGRVVGLIDGFWQFFQSVYSLRDAGKGECTYMSFPVLRDPANMKWMASQSDGNVNVTGIGITKSCKNPEKIVNFFNYLATEEAQILKEWGIENVNYTVVDGKRVRNPKDVEEDMKDSTFCGRTGVKLYARGDMEWLQYGNGAKDSKGNIIWSEDPQPFIDAYTQFEKDTLAKYGVTNYVAMFPPFDSMPPRPYGSAASASAKSEEAKVAMAKVNEFVLKDIAAAIMGKTSEFDANWDKFMKHLEGARVDIVEKEISQQLRDRVELWSK